MFQGSGGTAGGGSGAGRGRLCTDAPPVVVMCRRREER